MVITRAGCATSNGEAAWTHGDLDHARHLGIRKRATSGRRPRISRELWTPANLCGGRSPTRNVQAARRCAGPATAPHGQNEIYRQFSTCLPNPDLGHCNVFPHLPARSGAGAQAYTRVFRFNQRVQYAPAGERVEDYLNGMVGRGPRKPVPASEESEAN